MIPPVNAKLQFGATAFGPWGPWSSPKVRLGSSQNLPLCEL